ncbi:MAG: hypothetical protein JST81_10895 [Bacteroidetes bacterium]|nr:hypothetical protein [Bacteroidota bacterium]
MKTGKVLLCVICVLTIYLGTLGQLPSTLPEMPKIIPPSPEAGALANSAAISTSLFTGAASVRIPLYEIQAGDIKLPISVNYSSNGIRVNDIPSRVGLGWNLIAGGVITKTIHDQDDDDFSTVRVPWPANTDYQSLFQFANDALLQNHDTQYDEYSFNVNGMSGKFFIDDNGDAWQTEHTSYKIRRFGSEFRLTTGDGTQYIFGSGGIVEKTHQHKFNGINSDNGTKTTSWFLTKIISANNENYIDFVYQPISIYCLFGQSQHVILRTTAPYNGIPNTTCAHCTEGSFPNPSPNFGNYDTWYLTQINSSSGVSVNFQYAPRPAPEASHDNRVTSIAVKRSGEPLSFKFFDFVYDDFFFTSGDYYDPNQRFYLKHIIMKSMGDAQPDQRYNFSYYDQHLPSQLSCALDYFGYYNGRANANLVPRMPDFQSYINGSLCANREPSFDYAVFGSLQKVTYPTGGSETFIYEPHTVVQNVSTTSTSEHTISTIGQGYSAENTLTFDFHITTPGATDRVELTTYLNPLGPPQNSPNYWPAGDGKIISKLKIVDQATQQIIYDASHTELTLTGAHPTFQANHNYRLFLTVKGITYKANAMVRYNPVTTTSAVNTAGCGIRVKQINSFDPVANKTFSKYYSYVTADRTSIGNLSSGVGRLATMNAEFYPAGGVCHLQTSGIPGIEMIEECTNMWEIGSSSIITGYLFGGSPIAYSSVLESDDPDFKHGAVQHEFRAVYDPITVGPYHNTPPSYAPGAMKADYNGTETLTRYLKKQDDRFVVQKEQENVYEDADSYYHIVYNHVVRKRWEAPGSSSWTYYDKLRGYDIGGYPMYTGWKYLSRSINRDFNENGENPVEQELTYVYGNTDNCLPTKIITTNSKGENLVQMIKYPNDFPGTDPYPDMVDRHIITPVVQQVNYNDGNFMNRIQNNFQRWTNTTAIPYFKPAEIVAGQANTTETAISYKELDKNGNPVHIVKADGLSYVYLWDYNNNFPIAEVVNAVPRDVAFTSFETHNAGNWTLSNSNYNYSEAMTGSYSYSGNLQKDVNTDQTYIVSLWAKYEALVNGLQGTVVNSKRGWTLYQWTIHGVSTVSVTGNTIDEVRLTPKDANITTYTYSPFVGVTTVSDANNNILYYSYDGFNRLWLIRDIDLNIIKQYQYRYGEQIAVTGDITPRWVPTGTHRCATNHGPNNYDYTGVEEEEEKDENNMSPTYGQSRWVTATIPVLNCTPINCVGPDKRMVNGVCETGNKIYTGSTSVLNGYDCIYRYEWSDGFQSIEFHEFNTTACTQIIIE